MTCTEVTPEILRFPSVLPLSQKTLSHKTLLWFGRWSENPIHPGTENLTETICQTRA